MALTEVYELGPSGTTSFATPIHKEKTVGLIVWLIVGLIAGFVARAVVPGSESMGAVGTIVLGLIGRWSVVSWAT